MSLLAVLGARLLRGATTVHWPPAKRDGQTELTSRVDSDTPSFGERSIFSNRPLWQSVSAEVCTLIGAGLSSIRCDRERRLVLATLGKGSVSLMEVDGVVAKAA
jgi:hypothetical protein